jgi:pimeloyl-ACP methyl ester carboxylesterase
MKFIVSFLMAVSVLATADNKTEYINRHLAKKANKNLERLGQLDKPAAITAGLLEQKLDHNNAEDTRTFKQRYFVNSTQAVSEDSPVILYICGEATCDEDQLGRKTLVAFAKELTAHIVTLEHRYYGLSQPFSTLTADNLKYLSTEYALRDLAEFQKYASTTLRLKGKWIAVGGSYAGSLAAYYRLKYPDNVVGALASSAPVKAKASFEEYDHHVAKVTGTECVGRVRYVVQQIEARLADSTRAAEIKALFGASDVTDDVDFLYVVADMGAFAVQYGFTSKFCNALNVEDPVAGYASVGKELFALFGMTPFMDSFQAAENLDPFANQEFALRQWMYQSCTEYGYYQVAYSDATVAARSLRIDLAYHNRVCKRLFGLETQVDDGATNKTYYEPLLVPEIHNVYLTNGSNDPWTNLSITKENGNDVNPNLTLYSLVGGSHCTDLGSGTSAAAVEARAQFLALARGWLTE